jgi:hypothetical protein
MIEIGRVEDFIETQRRKGNSEVEEENTRQVVIQFTIDTPSVTGAFVYIPHVRAFWS